MNYSIRNLVIAGGLAIVAIVAVLIYTSNVQQAAKAGQARVKVYVARVDVPAGTTAEDAIARVAVSLTGKERARTLLS